MLYLCPLSQAQGIASKVQPRFMRPVLVFQIAVLFKSSVHCSQTLIQFPVIACNLCAAGGLGTADPSGADRNLVAEGRQD